MIDYNLYCQQLERLRQVREVERKRPELINRKDVIFHYNNAGSHTSLATRQKLRELSWKVLMHPPYTPVLTLHHQTIICFDLYRIFLMV